MSYSLFSDALRYLPSRLIPGVVGILSIPLFTRLLTQEDYGNYLILQTVLNFIYALCFGWLITTAIRFDSAYKNTSFKHLENYLRVSQAIGCLIWIISCLFLPIPSEIHYCIIGIGWILLNSNFEYHMGWMRARQNINIYSLFQISKSIVGLVVSILLINYTVKNGAMIFLGNSIAIAIMLIIITVFGRFSYRINDQLSHKTSSTKDYLKFGIPVIINGLLITALSLQDRIFIAMWINSEATAAYGANYDLAEKTIFFLNSFILLPSSVISYKIFEKKGIDSALLFIEDITRYYLLLIIPLILIVVFFYKDLISLLLPFEYQYASMVFMCTSIGAFFVGVLHRYSSILTLHKRTDLILISIIPSFLLNLILCFYLIPRFGIFGAAWGTLLTYAFWLISTVVLCRKYKTFTFPKKTIIFSTLISFLVFGFLKIIFEMIDGVPYKLIAIIIALVIVYYLFWFTGEINNAEKKIIIKTFTQKI